MTNHRIRCALMAGLVCFAGIAMNACAAVLSGFAIYVSGNHLVDAAGHVVVLHGVNRSGTQYACAEGWGIFDGPHSAASVAAMKSWGINAVRVNGNEDCWLGINGVKRQYGGMNYRKAIERYVKTIEQHGMYVIFDLHHSAPGSERASGQRPMPDAAHSVQYWRSVAEFFKHDRAVIFDLFNEPYPNDNTDSPAAWKCVMKGSAGGTCSGFRYQAVGMQRLVNTVRGTGAKNVVLVSGPQYAGSLTHWLEWRPYDPAHQIAASIHVYWNNAGNPDWSPCYRPQCWQRYIAPVASRVPVITGEFGQHTCSGVYLYRPYLNWADAHGISYLAWAWFVQGTHPECGASEPAIISNYGGTPSREGLAYKQHLALPRRE